MKKVFFSFMLLMGVAVLSSCSNNEDVYTANTVSNETVESNNQLTELRTKILAYNQTLQPSAVTRGWRWWKWLILGASDAVGGLCGGLFGGVSASSIVAVAWASDIDQIGFTGTGSTRSVSDSTNTVNYSGIIINQNEYMEDYADSIGFLHNQAIIDFCSNTAVIQTFNSASVNEKINFIASTLQAVSNNDYISNLSERDKLVAFNKADLIKGIATSSETLSDFMNGLRNNSSVLGMTTSEIDVLEAYFEGLSQIIEHDHNGNYMNTILHYTDRSDLPSELKIKLGNIMILAYASFTLWGNSSMAN